MRSRTPMSEALQAELGRPHRIRKLGSSPRSHVWRVRLSAGDAVIKQLAAGPGADERFAREVAALRAAAAADPPVVPRLLGADPAERVLVVERIEDRTPPPDWIVGYATALAGLHSVPTAGVPLPRWSGPTGSDLEAFVTLAARLGTPAPDAVGTELTALLARLATRTGRGHLLHGDPCPTNDLHTAAGVRFVDFEQASLGDGTVELAYLRIGFPTCWCSTAPPPALLAEAEAAYRETSGRSVTPDELADACAAWLIRGDALVERAHRERRDHLARLPDEDWTWGPPTARERVLHRLGVVGDVADADGPLGETKRLAVRLRAAMVARWPGLRALPERRG
ncbi:phosphotransferase [Catenulispora subtropica]|uniref:Aminoglycoside phosphotransferase domain-containing protein n=1 Tax=Catenulispora subtropica TaxID=450798 RepID=A0ABN2TB88_9ACTN